jgi:hypothetical protein
VFRNNRNKQKTNRNSSKFVKITTFFIPLTISSVCFDTGPKHRNKPKQKIFGFSKKQTKKQLKQTEFRFVWFEPRIKTYGFEDPLIENVFWIFSVCFDTGPKHRNKPKKMFFGFAKQTEKQPKHIEFRFVSDRTENKI